MKDSSGNTVAGTTTFNSGDTVATFTPSSSLAAGTTYTVTVSGAQDSSGQTMTSYSYTFITSKSFPADCPCTVWPDVAPSTATDPSDSSPNNIGVEFQASENGTISGIRFYKESDDTGTHTGTLWTSTGTELATGTFTNEPTQGWAELDFSTPVSITAGTTYVASYQTQTGHYAFTSEGLSSPVTNGPLTATAGVYAYGSSNTFPTNTYLNSNFWVDVVFNPAQSSGTAPSVTSVTPVGGSSSNPVSTAPTVTFSEAVVSEHGVGRGEGLQREHGGRDDDVQ